MMVGNTVNAKLIKEDSIVPDSILVNRKRTPASVCSITFTKARLIQSKPAATKGTLSTKNAMINWRASPFPIKFQLIALLLALNK